MAAVTSTLVIAEVQKSIAMPQKPAIDNLLQMKYGQELPDDMLHASSTIVFEGFEERVADGLMRAESLTHMISLAEEYRQEELKPEASTQYGIHLDSKSPSPRKDAT